MIGAVSLMPCENFRGMRIDVIEKLKELGIQLLRWPGGNFAGDYNWKDGLLPRNMRAPLQANQVMETQIYSNSYDFHEINTDDFIALCREIGAEPFITINPTWNTPEESAQWVEYCNGGEDTLYGKLRAENGHPEPYNVQFWSLGNEMGYGHMEGANFGRDYARNVRRHAEQMKSVSAEITLVSSGPYPNREWVNEAAKKLSDVAPVITLHHYAEYPKYMDSERYKEEYEEFIHKIDTEFLARLQYLREQLAGTNIRISFDEWNSWLVWFREGSVTEGIMTAAFLHMLFCNAEKYGVEMACYFQVINEGAMLVDSDGVRLTASGQVFAAMKNHANGMVCVLDDDIVATCKESVVTATLLNRSFDKMKRFTVDNCGEVISSVIYRSEDVLPNSVFEIEELPVSYENNTLEVILPPHSLGVIQTKAVRYKSMDKNTGMFSKE